VKWRAAFLLGVFSLSLIFGTGAETTSRWDRVPAKDHVRPNPLANDVNAVVGGAALYQNHCAQCHGKDATGSRKKPSLKTESIRSASDGDIEWFLRQGDLRHGMPSWSSLPQTQRWEIVSYLRSLQKP